MGEIEWASTADLVRYAADRGVLSADTARALQERNVRNKIEVALAGSFAPPQPGDLLLVTLQPDDSQSMASGDRQSSALAGHNELLEMMVMTPGCSQMMLQTRHLNGRVVNPFSPLHLCRRLDTENYRLSPLGTPLYTQTLVTLGAVLAKTEELTRQGCRVRTATLIITDGEPTDFTPQAQADLTRLIADMHRVGDHIVAGMGIGRKYTYEPTFKQMGVDPIFAADSRAEILEAFRLFARKALERGSF